MELKQPKAGSKKVIKRHKQDKDFVYAPGPTHGPAIWSLMEQSLEEEREARGKLEREMYQATKLKPVSEP